MKNLILAVLAGFIFSHTVVAEVAIIGFMSEDAAYKNRPAATNLGESAIHFFQGGKEVSAAVEGEPIRAVRWFTIPDGYNQKGKAIGVFLLFWEGAVRKHILTLSKEAGHPTVRLEMSFTPNAGDYTLVFISLGDDIADSRSLTVKQKRAK